MTTKRKNQKTKTNNYNQQKNNYEEITVDDIIDLCVKKGLIERTTYGYYFKREFFETLDVYHLNE